MSGNDIITNLRRSYSLKELSETLVLKDPVEQFSIWMNEAINSNIIDPHAMILATSSNNGKPSARVVLLREFDNRGFVFYSNYQSAKAKDLNENPAAALLFFWAELERQVRIEGIVEKISREESEKYFASRPREHQISAWASNQSEVITNREVLERQFEQIKQKFSGKEIPLPPFWGGYRVTPNRFEFWQGRESRLHDRIRYTIESGSWKIERLSP